MFTVERPGFGNSTPKPDRTIVDWGDDFAQVADALGLHGFALAGTSGAGPYLCAAAWRLGGRIRRVGLFGVVSPVTPPEVRAGLPLWRAASLAAARYSPSGVLKILRSRGLDRDPEALYRMMTRDAPPVDRRVIERIWDRQVRMTAEAVRQGLDAFVWELHLGAKPWGFDLGAIRTDVRLWHGEQDAATPLVMGRYLAEHIPRCRARFLPDAGHFLHHERWPDVLDMLMEA
jgi:pimeloyl-ACP methyl ester carboxylesterase